MLRTALGGRGHRAFSAASTVLKVIRHGAAPQKVPLLINGEFVESQSSEFVPVLCPVTQQVLAHTPIATQAEMEAAAAAAQAAASGWADTSVSNRTRVMFKLQALIREHTEELAQILTAEQQVLWHLNPRYGSSAFIRATASLTFW